MHAEDSHLDMLDGERLESIVDASVACFGTYGYKGAHTSDIARAANMSKGALFFYFKNKRNLYEYVVNAMYEKAIDWIVDDRFWEIDDFFDRMLYVGDAKKAAFDKHPHVFAFALQAFYPSHREAQSSMAAYSYGKIDEMLDRLFSGINFGKFKDTVSPRYVTSMMVWLADGWMHEKLSLGMPVTMDDLLSEFHTWCTMLRHYAYKSEFL